MGLSEALSQFKNNYPDSGEGSGSNDTIVEPYQALKNGQLRLGSGKSSSQDFYARILPWGESSFSQDFSQVGISTPSKNGSTNDSILVSSAQNDPNDPLKVAMNRWGNRVVSRYNKLGGEKGQGFKTRFLLNVIPLVQQNGQLVEETDEAGQYKVMLLNLSYTQFKQLEGLLTNTINNPTSSQFYSQIAQQYGVTQTDDWSFISPQIAYPVHFGGSVNLSNNIFESHVELLQSQMLAPLQQGWETLLEDLAYQATPSYQYKPKVVEWAIAYQDELLGFTNQAQAQPQAQPQVQANPWANQQPQGQVPVAPVQQAPASQFTQPVASVQGVPTMAQPQTQPQLQPQAPVTQAPVPPVSTQPLGQGQAPSPADLGFTTATQKAQPQAQQPQSQVASNTMPADPFEATSNIGVDITEDDLPF